MLRVITLIGAIGLATMGGAAPGEPSLVLADGGIQFPDGSVQFTAAGGPAAPVEQTGQTQCFDEDGIEITCTGTGQDGDLRRGAGWPNPRFTDHGDGTVTDNLTNLVWLKDANCFGTQTWENALATVGNLADPACGLSDGSTAGTWRLPNVRELSSLNDFGRGGPALPPGHPFVNVVSNDYWTSTSRNDAFGPADAWQVTMNSGGIHDSSKAVPELFWPVKGGP